MYKKSCSLGSYEGMYHLATHYHYGIGVEKNIKEAIRLYNLVSKNQNYNKNKTSAVFSLSKLYEENKDYKNAFKLADHFRLKEKFVGYLLCSDFLSRGVGVEVNQELADEYLEAASQDKFINEQLKFAMIFRHGKGVTKNEEEFLKWIKIAAENGSPSGFFHYGKELLDGKLTSRNIVEGLKMLKNAADMGHIKALKKLIDIYKNGLYNINRNEELANQYEVKLSQIPRPSKY